MSSDDEEEAARRKKMKIAAGEYGCNISEGSFSGTNLKKEKTVPQGTPSKVLINQKISKAVPVPGESRPTRRELMEDEVPIQGQNVQFLAFLMNLIFIPVRKVFKLLLNSQFSLENRNLRFVSFAFL